MDDDSTAHGCQQSYSRWPGCFGTWPLLFGHHHHSIGRTSAKLDPLVAHTLVVCVVSQLIGTICNNFHSMGAWLMCFMQLRCHWSHPLVNSTTQYLWPLYHCRPALAMVTLVDMLAGANSQCNAFKANRLLITQALGAAATAVLVRLHGLFLQNWFAHGFGILAKPIVNVWLHGFIVFVQEQLGEVLYGDPDICSEYTQNIFKVISTKCWYERNTWQTQWPTACIYKHKVLIFKSKIDIAMLLSKCSWRMTSTAGPSSCHGCTLGLPVGKPTLSLAFEHKVLGPTC